MLLTKGAVLEISRETIFSDQLECTDKKQLFFISFLRIPNILVIPIGKKQIVMFLRSIFPSHSIGWALYP